MQRGHKIILLQLRYMHITCSGFQLFLLILKQCILMDTNLRPHDISCELFSQQQYRMISVILFSKETAERLKCQKPCTLREARQGNRLQHVCSLIKVSAWPRVVTPDVVSLPEAKQLNAVRKKWQSYRYNCRPQCPQISFEYEKEARFFFESCIELQSIFLCHIIFVH